MASGPLPVRPEGIPDKLKARRQWVPWKIIARPNEKPTKKLLDVRTGSGADSTEPATWTDFDTALIYSREHNHPGVGYVFSDDDPYTGVDLDPPAIDPATGKLKPWAAEIVTSLNTFTEISQSGGGVHCICIAKKPGERCVLPKYHDGKIEIYDHSRFFAMTGHPYPGTGEIREAQAEIDHWYWTWFPPTTKSSSSAGQGPVDLDDQELLARGFGFKNGSKLRALYEGQVNGHGSPSEADWALNLRLAWLTGKDRDRMDRLFRNSGLMRPKWDSKRGTTTYGWMTIDRAIEICSDVYRPRKPGRAKHEQAKPEPQATAQPEQKPGEQQRPEDIIRDYWIEYWKPTHKQGEKIYSESSGVLVSMGALCKGADSELIERLKTAKGAPTFDGKPPGPENVKVNSLPQFFNTWSRTAWMNLWKNLPEETNSDEVSEAAQEDFCARLSAAMHHIVRVGERHGHGRDAYTEVETRSLIELCLLFAVLGGWKSIRSYQIWTRKDEGRVRIALHAGLFKQIGGDLAQIGQNKFGRLCEHYGVGQRLDKVKGGRAVELTAEFIDQLTPMGWDERTKGQADTRAHGREENVKTSQNEVTESYA